MNYLQKKKQAFMSIVNSIKGFVRSVSGAPPITLENCPDDHSLINYQIFGNSIQDGEPTPAAPVDIETVGEKTINLVNYKDFVKSGKTRKILYGIQFEITNSRIDIGIPITLKANTNYVLSADCTKDGFVGGLIVNNGTANDWCTKTRKNLYISNTTDTDINTQLRVVDTTGTQGSVVKNIMLIEGATAKEFVPYGYEIPVTAFPNDFNINDIDNMILDSYYCLPIQLKPNTKYALSVSYNDYTRYVALSIGVTYGSAKSDDRIWINHKTSESLQLKPGQAKIFTTTDNGMVYLCTPSVVTLDAAKAVFTTNIQGLVIQEYDAQPITTNIYLDEPLRKLGDYADYIDFKESKIYRYSAVKYITKDWSWTRNTSTTTKGMYGNYISMDMEKGTRLPGYCNVLPANKQGWNAWTYPQIHFGQANRAPYIITETQMATNEDLYNYLSNNGEVEPYIVYIKGDIDGIIEPTEEELQLPSIPGLPTFKGNTTYTIETNIQPSNMAADYYSTVKGD